ncbi:hypothetical protein MINS_39910 [Mycolicibacterium insubricum]|jgi:hypothetical protein|uniref:Uncharacterized protein n=1 Tax=Mycolicibacterium insubricum TaxID=444597 RepID=A0A1X0DLD8_9MYCO|nr:hypothetical protein [Mycolicibacterium insubricum]MCB9441911.1 hypothetical protein [Mycolicibacterium sp.]MCV7083987.1 hypothetical protein [Mycolicibacterium insubricum]ORA73147.1 hypothetical protein BST26_03745 [Mycolicibacterium insubricum]BBZ68562.1 hypothetical protein MINS_39910 [Mycolicibacterium insubricum]
MPRKPILSAGVALVSAAAIVAAGPSLFAPGSGQVEAAPGSKPLENVHVGYRMTSLSDITLQGFLDALSNGYTGTVFEPDPDYPANVEIGSPFAAAYYLVDKALGSGVEADDWYFWAGPQAGLEVGFSELTGGPDTPQAAVAHYLLNPLDAVYLAGNSLGDGIGDLLLQPGVIPMLLAVSAADLVSTDLGDVLNTLFFEDEQGNHGTFAATAVVIKKVLQQVSNTLGIDVLGTPVGSLVDQLAKVGAPKTEVASLVGDTTRGVNPSNGEIGGNEDLGAADQKDAKLTQSFAVASTEAQTLVPGKVVDKKLALAALPAAQPAAEVTPPAAATEPSVTPDVATKGNLITPVVGAAAPTVAVAGEDAEHPVGATAAKDQLSEQNLTVNDGVGSGPSTAKKAPGQKKASGANLGQRMQDTTNRITGGLQKAGERISNALSGGSQKQTVKKDDGGQQDAKPKNDGAGKSYGKKAKKQESKGE